MKPTTLAALDVIERWAHTLQPFTVNDLRRDLDAAAVPLASRGRVFKLATDRGIVRLLSGATVSTNRASRGDHVARYVGAQIATPCLPSRPQPRDEAGRFHRPGQTSLDI